MSTVACSHASPRKSYLYMMTTRSERPPMTQLAMFGASPLPTTGKKRISPTFPQHLRDTIADPLQLNPEQLAVIQAPHGPILVIAGAGSGKTKVLVYRTAWLIADGIHPSRILLITFTRKAATQMLTRVQEINPLPRHTIHGGTFHSMAATWLKTHGSALNLSPRFTILDESESASLLHVLASKQRLNQLKGFPSKRTLLSLYGFAANSMTTIADTIIRIYPQYEPYTPHIEQLHRLFRDTKWAQQRFDYDDLLLLVHRLLIEQPESAARLTTRYQAILVDEYQDTTRIQAEIVRLMGSSHRNVLVVGDDSQCLRQDTPVLTPEGYRPVQELRVGDSVISASGAGQVSPCRIVQTSTSWPQDFVRITTRRGYTVDVSPQHTCFAKPTTAAPAWYVYLMYREGWGYRIGITSVTQHHRNARFRTTQENADKFWFLKACPTKYSAQYQETLWSIRYQIPQTLYEPHLRTKSGRMTNAQAKGIFDEFGRNGYLLLKDLGLDFDTPAYSPKASRSANRISVNLIQCNSKRKGHNAPRHLLVAESRLGSEVACNFQDCITTKGYWRIRVQSSDYRLLFRKAEELKYALRRAGYNAVLIRKANFLKSSDGHNTSLFMPMPAAGLVTGMTIPIHHEGSILCDEIATLERLPNIAGIPFYDLEVEHSHNIITNSLVTHNSIYSFRSADVHNMAAFPLLFDGTTTFTLVRNYRSTTPIVHVANKVLEGAPHLHPKTLLAQRQSATRPQLVQCPDEPTESTYIIEQIRGLQQQGLGLHRIAVLFRSSAHSYDLETALARYRLPFVKYGGLALTETAHVKDFLAYLTVARHPNTRTAWHRLLLLIDRIGPATAEQLITSMKTAARPFDVLRHHQGAAAQDLNHLATILTQLHDDAIPLGLRLQAILDHYAGPLKRHYPEDMRERLSELTYLTQGFKDLKDLNDVVEALHAPSTSTRKESTGHPSDTLVLSTIHSAKGLEWDAVFIIHVADGQLPHIRSFSDPANLEEERRLLYVAITRPRYRLWLTYPLNAATSTGHKTSGRVSRFLETIDDTILDRIMIP